MGRSSIRHLALALAFFPSAAPVIAQGSSVYNQGACASGLGGAVAAAPCGDGSAIYYNPAALALLPSVVSVGFTAIRHAGTFTYDTTGLVVERDAAVPIVPQGYGSLRFGRTDRLAVGFGVFAPYGLGIEWPRTFEGRFISWRTDLRGIYLQPTIAYQLVPGRLAIGGGPQIVFGGMELNQHLDAPVLDGQLAAIGLPLGTDVAAGRLSGSGTGFGGHIGLYLQATDRLALAARYMHSVQVDLSGEAVFTPIWNPDRILSLPSPAGGFMHVPLDSIMAPLFGPGGPLADRTAEASLTLPAQAVVGFRFAATDRLELSADLQWTGWSTFDEMEVRFEGGDRMFLILDYEDTHTWRLGASYLATPDLRLLGGYVYNAAAAPDRTVTPILPDADRELFAVGAGYRIGRVRADVYYNYAGQADRRGRVRDELPGGIRGEALNVGIYGSTAHLVGLTVSYHFDLPGSRH
jgi:long-chain fatty acid transport protein